jgi:hypothetical protein
MKKSPGEGMRAKLRGRDEGGVEDRDGVGARGEVAHSQLNYPSDQTIQLYN